MSKFTFEDLGIPGPKLVRPRRFGDARGYVMETYSLEVYAEAGIAAAFVQDNQSLSAQRGVVRGLEKTVRWYLDNPDWWGRIRSGLYRGERLGLA